MHTPATTSRSLRCALPATALAVVLACSGCSSLHNSGNETGCDCSPNASAEQSTPATLGKQRRILAEGYSLLYRDAKRLNLVDLLLMAKSESDAVKQIVTDVADYGQKVQKDLERIDRDYPGVRIDIDALPDMEKRKRFAVGKDRMIEYAPLIGRSGRDYERTILLSLLNGINHQSHMCKVMADEEPEASLKQFLLDTEKGYERLYARIEKMLEKEYFK